MAAIVVALVLSNAGGAGADVSAFGDRPLGRAAATTGASAAARPWLDARQPIEQRVLELLAALTLDEKVHLMYGVAPPASSPAAGYIPGIPRLGVPPQVFSDGPVGLRDSASNPRRATAMPATVSLAASFDPVLATAYGRLLGNEARARGASVLYGPAMNIVRVPLGGRNFEYFSEDPYLTAQMAVPYVQGVQSQRVAAQIKHFALNNQENDRHTASSNADQRTMQEIYLPAWQAAVQQGHAWSLMCANNKVNGIYSCESSWLLHDTLSTAWGFDGVVGSDYAATRSAVGSVNAGLDQSFTLQDWGAFYRDLPQLVRNGQVSEATIDDHARRVLRMMFRVDLFDPDPATPAVSVAAHAASARIAAEEGTVLLRNQRSLLPLRPAPLSTIAVIGPYATHAYTGGGGSSQVLPYYSVSPAEGIAHRAGAKVAITSDDGSDVLRAAALARRSGVVILVVGDQSREGHDRADMDLPGNQNQLIDTVAAANPNTVVVLQTGAPVTMPWLDRVRTLVEGWYPGEEHGNALAAVLFGDVDPSGRLPVTFPVSADRVASMGAPRYPAGPNGYDYTEGLNVGYRAYDAHGTNVLFPFGYGLSYTGFALSGLALRKSGSSVQVTFTVTNTGMRTGISVPQVYLRFPVAAGEPPQQLKAFTRLGLLAHRSRRVTVALPAHAFEYWSSGRWRTAQGAYTVSVGTSSRSMALASPLTAPTAPK
ncbi:MAG: glycoside hydrolase family 3 C-terminal domain-containing protein [Actinomycetota bacterium]|nr:glycoside hydrolase family 3 C-terminal domain-containing protein [Actinomycetota bacterium]